MKNNIIPKKIHYCWFGGKPKPAKVLKCIESWKKILIDYEIIEWNEENFDINYSEYTKQAYNSQKYAFVSDIARLVALKNYGGIYLDTDVEVLKSFDDLLNNDCFLGFEETNKVATSILACTPNHKLIYDFLLEYDELSFYNYDGSLNLTTNVSRLTSMLSEMGFRMDGSFQKKINISIYPQEYFSPYDYINCIYEITNKSYCVHHFYVTWLSNSTRCKKLLKGIFGKYIGKKNMNKIRKCFNKI